MSQYDIYLDNAATTKPFKEIAELAEKYVSMLWYNPSAMYPPAVETERALNNARKIIADACGAKNVLFTSCGTEGNNTAILRGYKMKGARKLHFITSVYEHPAAYEAFKYLESSGHEVSYIMPQNGIITPESVAEQVREDTALVSIMHVNNETGAVNDIAAIAAAVKKKNAETLFHSDGVQAFMRVGISLKNTKIDYYSVSAHKIHGLKGVGALMFRDGTPLKPYIMGGGQEKGLRSGTENVFGALAFALAVEKYSENKDAYIENMLNTKETLKRMLNDAGVKIIQGDAPHILAASVEGVRGETLLHVLEQKGIYISVGSACSSKKGREPRLKKALGLTEAETEGFIRLSFSPFNTVEQAEIAGSEIIKSAAELRKYFRR